MSVKQVKNFYKYMNERHKIYLRRRLLHAQPPYTKDKILQQYHFCNVFRDLDRVSQYWWHNVAAANEYEFTPVQLWNTALFRAFNLPRTWEVMNGPFLRFSGAKSRVIKGLLKRAIQDGPVFSNAYIISPGGSTGPKHDYIMDSMLELWGAKKYVYEEILNYGRIEHGVRVLKGYPTFGNFTAYEVLCDIMRLNNVYFEDTMTWANPGPGAVRGLQWIYGERYSRKECIKAMRNLLALQSLYWEHKRELDMRAIEHSLCEFDKYNRVKSGAGYRRKFNAHSVRTA